jgi:hypothetical protein
MKKAKTTEQKVPIMRLRLEDWEAVHKIARGRSMLDAVHDVLEAGVRSIREDLEERVRKLEADRLLIEAFLKGRSPSVLAELKAEGLL